MINNISLFEVKNNNTSNFITYFNNHIIHNISDIYYHCEFYKF